jgi:hypothetical protein
MRRNFSKSLLLSSVQDTYWNQSKLRKKGRKRRRGQLF